MKDLCRYRDIAFAGREAIREIQQCRLRAQPVYSGTHSPVYRERLKQVGIDCAGMGLEPLSALPFTGKADVSDHMTIHAAVNGLACTADVIQERLQGRFRVRPEVVIADEEAVRQHIFTPESRKPVRLMDRR